MTLWDGRILRLGDSHLTLFGPNGTVECSYPRNHITDCTSSPTTWDVFLRFWNKEEIALLASSSKDTDEILRWASTAPRLQRRSAVREHLRKRRARSRMVSGGLSFTIGVALLLFTHHIAKPGGYYLVPVGAIGLGGPRFFVGVIEHYVGK